MSKKKVLKRWVRALLLVIIILIFCFSIINILNNSEEKQQKPYFNYTVSKDADYKVYLKSNNFFEESYLERDKQYTSEIIDYIDIDFKYFLNSSSHAIYNYSYEIDGIIIGEYDNKNNEAAELWTKEYKFLEPQNRTFEGTEIAIIENLKIKYDEYDSIVKEFKSKFKLAIDAYLKVTMKVKYQAKIDNYEEEISGSDNVIINIPLSKAIIEIDTRKMDDISKTLYQDYNNTTNNKTIGFSLLTIDIILFIALFKYIFINTKSLYRKKIDKFLKDYSEIIVESSNPINYEGLEIIEITNFDDMVDTEEELKSPIIMYEAIKEVECHFVVVNGKYAYRYILKADIDD